jgi:hypothetical protein
MNHENEVTAAAAASFASMGSQGSVLAVTNAYELQEDYPNSALNSVVTSSNQNHSPNHIVGGYVPPFTSIRSPMISHSSSSFSNGSSSSNNRPPSNYGVIHHSHHPHHPHHPHPHHPHHHPHIQHQYMVDRSGRNIHSHDCPNYQSQFQQHTLNHSIDPHQTNYHQRQSTLSTTDHRPASIMSVASNSSSNSSSSSSSNGSKKCQQQQQHHGYDLSAPSDVHYRQSQHLTGYSNTGLVVTAANYGGKLTQSSTILEEPECMNSQVWSSQECQQSGSGSASASVSGSASVSASAAVSSGSASAGSYGSSSVSSYAGLYAPYTVSGSGSGSNYSSSILGSASIYTKSPSTQNNTTCSGSASLSSAPRVSFASSVPSASNNYIGENKVIVFIKIKFIVLNFFFSLKEQSLALYPHIINQ